MRAANRDNPLSLRTFNRRITVLRIHLINGDISFQFVVPVRTLCNGDLDRNLKFEVYDHNKSGNHSYIGEFFATARNLIEQKSGSSFTCVNLKKKVCV